MALQGRPRLFEDKPVKKNFDLPKDLVEELQSAAKNRKQPAVAIVRMALEKELGITSDAQPKSRAVPTISEAAIEKALLSALAKHHEKETVDANSYVVELAPDLKSKLEAVSESAGFVEPGDFIEEVMRVMLRDPAQLRELVIGKTIRDLEAVIGSLSEEETPQKKSRRVA